METLTRNPIAKARQSRLWAILGSDVSFSLLMAALFFLVGMVGLLHHSMWRDETNTWLQARFSGSFRDLYLIARYDTHFLLWHLLLWGLTRVTHNCQAMQWLHLTLATCGVWLVAQ